MVIYFSATGNTKFIASNIASSLDDMTIDLSKRIKNNDYSDIVSEKTIIICLPVYICTMPTFLYNYLSRIKILGNKNVYFIFTSGGYTGMSGTKAKKLARKLKLKYMGHSDFKMPRNYLISGHYPPNTDLEVEERIKDSYNKLSKTIESIKKLEKVKERYVFLLEKLIIIPFVPVWEKLKHKTDLFYTTDKCVGCTKCANICPINAIKMENGKPLWIKDRCLHCMSCLQNCNFEAIEYKGKTEGKKRYSINRYKNVLNELKE